MTILKNALFACLTVALMSSCGTSEQSVRFDGEVRYVIAISDLNSSYGSTEYEDEVGRVVFGIIQKHPDLVICTGDMIAGQKTTLTDQNLLEMWDAFDEKILTPLSEAGIPVMFTVGNHDASKSPTFERDQHYANEFWEKQKGKLGIKLKNAEHFPFYYSAEFENLNVISWDASGAQFSREEWQWIDEELANSSQLKPTIVLGHLPIYPVAQGRNKRGEYLAHGDSVLMMLADHNVDAYFSGHHHAFYPGKRDSVLLIANGALGGGPRMLIGSDLPAQKSYTEFRIDEAGNISAVYGYQPDGNEINSKKLPSVIRGESGFVYQNGIQLPGDLKRELRQESLSAELRLFNLGYELELTGIITASRPLASDRVEITISSKADALTERTWIKSFKASVENAITIRFKSTIPKEEAREVRELLAFGLIDIDLKEFVVN
jgi:predicted MPP superfamily phosphohydrolase